MKFRRGKVNYARVHETIICVFLTERLIKGTIALRIVSKYAAAYFRKNFDCVFNEN